MQEEQFAAPTPPAPAKPKKGELPGPEIGEMLDQVKGMAARVRVGEQRYGELRKKLLVIENNMLINHKKAMNEIKSFQSDLLEVKRTIQVVEDRIITIIKELRLTARKEDIDVMKKYIEIWDPTKFVYREHVEKIIDEKLGKMEELKPPNYDSPS